MGSGDGNKGAYRQRGTKPNKRNRRTHLRGVQTKVKMRYTIYRKVFTCENGEEYRAIDGFWDEMASLYGRDNLFGIAYHWSNGTLHYGIGHKTKDISRNRYMSGFLRGCKLVEIEIPDDGWEVHKLDSVEGDQLEKFYEQIWKEGCLDCEMEELYESGGATISLHYERKKRRQV